MNKRMLATLLAAALMMPTALADTGSERMSGMDYESPYQGNPYLPLWEYIPDGEPYVFEDPDHPGQYRAYIYGSHDMLKTAYCGKDLVVWSAPVDDLSHWRFDGVIFESVVGGVADTLFAPDIALAVDPETGAKTYYLYPNTQAWGRNAMVCKSDRPDGPFTVINWRDSAMTTTYGTMGFDPAVLVDDDGEAYGYWGFCDAWWGRLNPGNMAALKPGESARRNIPSYDQMTAADYQPADYNIVQDENVGKWGFFEASSIRKVGNKYVFIYSRNGLPSEPTGKNYNQLAYGYSDSPAGPWKWGGVIVDAQGEVIPNGPRYERTFPGGNTHGSICEINGQWYVFYHRNLHAYARQAMVEPIAVEWDEKPVTEGGEVRISMAEVTSNGFYLDGLNPYAKISAGRACYLTGGASIVPAYSQDTLTLPVTGLKNNAVVGIKYLNFDLDAPYAGTTSLEVELIPQGVDAAIDVYLRPASAANTPVSRTAGVITSVGEGSVNIGTIELTADMPREMTALRIPAPGADEVDGPWGLFLVFRAKGGGDICELYNMQFVDGEEGGAAHDGTAGPV